MKSITKDEALKEAYKTLKDIAENATSYENGWCGAEAEKVLPVIEKALAQPAQEPMVVPGFIRQRLEREIESAINPKGMSVHDGRTRALANDIAYLLKVIDLYTTPPAAQPAQEPLAIEAEKFIAKEERKRKQKYAYVPKLHPSEWMDEPAQEPVAWGFKNSAITGSNQWMMLREKVPLDDQYKGALWTPLYTTPPQRPWVGLTNNDWNSTAYDTEFRAGAEWAEAKLKEKNT